MTPVDRALGAQPWAVRVAAIAALAELADEREVRQRLVPALRDEQAEVRIAAARALLRLGPDEHAVGVLVAELDAEHEEVRLSAAIELAQQRDARGAQTLAQLVRSQETNIRSAAVRAHLQAQRITPELVGALADVSAEVRVDAAATLLELTD
jgi:HEAT repeat protein